MHLIQNIQITATWLAKVNTDFETNLFRTPELMPDRHFLDIPADERPDVLAKLTLKRSELLKAAHVALIPVEELEQHGRIMYFEVDCTFCDGAPMEVSCFYVDINDTPPQDTWICTGGQLDALGLHKGGLADEALVAWVPKSQYYFANQAMLFACVDNLWWPETHAINQEHAALMPVFQKPENILEPKGNIKWENRAAMLYIITKTLDNNLARRKYNQELFQPERISILPQIWKWLANRK